MKPAEWPLPVIVLLIVLAGAVWYLAQEWMNGALRTIIGLVAGGVILVLGVTLADRLMSNGDKDDARRSRE